MGGDFRDFETFGFTVIDVLARGVLSKEYVSMTHLPLPSMRLKVSVNTMHILNRLFSWRRFTYR
ncbi:hypothetical protein A3D11_03220 [Candidatus Peribacteria bacterium RIFCSPHIGHO2_02_FULL_49_16]|nr:MAG: hypothetical protein A2880_03085 [Candidatus Peribacteria bacterium RIFCSPHIGHO2_01_FULL_49_38]OGJ59328.1 MAG: hypothetical protein A3D11_03220 [Candidatus Peribacteria bacterium RIFCSPHIGHO2_02_FULL_49_16]